MKDRIFLNKATAKELGEFHARFCPYADQLYRDALIVTGNPRSANKLGAEIYLKAFMEYLQAERIVNFKNWLIKIIDKYFSKAKLGKLKPRNADAFTQTRTNLLGKICACPSN